MTRKELITRVRIKYFHEKLQPSSQLASEGEEM